MAKRIIIGLSLVILTGAGLVWAQGGFFDDANFFSSAEVKPNVFVLLDRSGSMCWRPQDTYYPCANGDWAAMCGTQYGTPNTSKIALATGAIKSIMDADSNGVVEDRDSLFLNVRLGYGHFYNSSGEGSGIYVPYNNDTIGTRYSRLWSDISSTTVCNGTPLNQSLWLSKELVRTTHVREGSAWWCRKSFVIVITDGSDTWGCNGYGSGGSPSARRAGVNVAFTSFKHDSIPVYVIGFPDRGDSLNQANTLNWMAYCGGTKTGGPYSGDTLAYTPQNTGTTYLTCGNNSNVDPGTRNLSGYAYFVTNLGQLRSALKSIFKEISESSGSSFSPPSVPANFTTSSILLVNNFDARTYPIRWQGHLGAFAMKGGDLPVKPGGGLDTSALRWDAGNLLRARNITSDPRLIVTPIQQSGGAYANVPLNDTASGSITPQLLGFAPNQWDSMRTMVDYMYYDSAGPGTRKFGWMGDPFHAGPVDVGYPNPFFTNDSLYSEFAYRLRYDPQYSRKRRVYLQTNDGMLHMFSAGYNSEDSTQGGGRELWALVPANTRPWLQDMLYAHDYNLDGPMVSTHILKPELYHINQYSWQDWRTILIAGERTGGRYYYAVDITHPDSSTASGPKYLWECGPASTDSRGQANGDSAMGFTFGMATVCRVWDSTGTNRKDWSRYVAFLPGGFDCQHTRRGNFVLALDAYTGERLAKIPLGDSGVAAPVRPVDSNYDGYVDRLYVGDLNGDMWRINLNHKRTQWYAKRLFQPNGDYRRPIFGQVSVASDFLNTLWIMWGTGDRNHPTDPSYQNRNAFFAVQDKDTSETYGLTDLVNTRNAHDCQNPNTVGWYYDLWLGSDQFFEVYTNPVTVSDTVRTLAWTPNGSPSECEAAGAGTDSLISFYYQCGVSHSSRSAGSGIPPYQLSWGIDRQGNVTTLLPNLSKMVLGYINRGKFIRVWREVY